MDKVYVHSYIQVGKHKPGVRYDKVTRETVVNLVREVGSFTGVARLTGLSPYTVKKWCDEAGVPSKYKTSKVKDDDIIRFIEEKKVVKYKEIEKKFGQQLQSRLRRLVSEGKVKKVRIPKAKSKLTRKLIKDISKTNIYYISDEDFVKWLRSKFPEKMTSNDKRCFTRILNDVSIKGDEV